MTDYKHMMEQIALSDEKKEDILDTLQNQPTRRRRRPAVNRLAIAAALVLACLLCIAAGAPDLMAYHFANGGSASMEPEGPRLICGDSAYCPVEVREGRLWFVADGQDTDITDLVDEETPYIYTRTDTVSGAEGYVVVGGTLEDFGWAEFYLADGVPGAFGTSVNASEEILEIDGQRVSGSELTAEQWEQIRAARGAAPAGEDPFHGTILDHPWLTAAKDQLGIYP